MKFTEYLTEAKEGKNVHLEHIEDEVLNRGVVGAMIFDHKTAGRLEYVNPKNKQAVETLKRFVNRARN